jgi:hypothetical protein
MQSIKTTFIASAAASFLLITAANATHVLSHHAAHTGGGVYNRAPISHHGTKPLRERKEQEKPAPFGGY